MAHVKPQPACCRLVTGSHPPTGACTFSGSLLPPTRNTPFSGVQGPQACLPLHLSPSHLLPSLLEPDSCEGPLFLPSLCSCAPANLLKCPQSHRKVNSPEKTHQRAPRVALTLHLPLQEEHCSFLHPFIEVRRAGGFRDNAELMWSRAGRDRPQRWHLTSEVMASFETHFQASPPLGRPPGCPTLIFLGLLPRFKGGRASRWQAASERRHPGPLG